MRSMKRPAALVLFLAMLFSAALGDGWHAAEENLPRFAELFDLLGASCAEPYTVDTAAADAVLEAIRAESADDYAFGRAVTDHWYATVCDPDYRMFLHRGGDRALVLERSGLKFGGRHAFVVLGYQLTDGMMTWELTARCDAAAAAARSFPDSILICTGGATGPNNPEGHTEAGEMKKYLTGTCGIDKSRVFTEDQAMSTMENAVNTFRILKAQGIESYTIVTSDYHQRWGQILFNAVAAVYERNEGYRVRLEANYSYPARPDATGLTGCRSALSQLNSLLRRGVGTGP